MKSDGAMTIGYDKKTQASYAGILEDKPFRTAQPKVSTLPLSQIKLPRSALIAQKRVTYHHHEDVGNFHFVLPPPASPFPFLVSCVTPV